MPITNWREQAYGVVQSLLFNNPVRTVRFMVPAAGGGRIDRAETPAPVRRLAETAAEAPRNCLRTIQFVHHVWIPPGGRHVHELHTHPDAEELILITSGQGLLALGDEPPRPVAEGDLAYVAPNQEHVLRNESGNLLGALFINVPVGEGLRRLLEQDSRHAVAPGVPGTDPAR